MLQRSVQTNFIRTYNTKEIELQEINGTLAKFWEIESVADNVGRIMNEDDKDTLDLVSKSLRYENGKYQVQIPWKKERHLTNNYQMALNRLDNTERRLIKQPELSEKYCEIIEQYIKKRYLEYVDVKNDSNDCWYLPHFPVVWPDKSTTKVRIVFNGASRYDGKSLNNVIQPGPKLQQDILDVLLRFKRYPVAIVCDIAKMFLRIGVHLQDRPYQRMLWRSLNQSEKPKILQFTCAVFGINSSPIYAQYVSQLHAKKNKKVGIK